MANLEKGEVDGPKDKGKEEGLAQRKADATSAGTLSDLEETEKDSSSGTSGLDPGPSPDGAFDENDELKDAGPM
jgi:hypothetical protein